MKFSELKLLYLVQNLEKLLALIIIAATLIFATFSIYEFIYWDWNNVNTFVLFVEKALYIAIGIELARLLLDYSLETLVELLAFVVARKLLIENNYYFVLLGITSLVILFASKHFFPRTFDNNSKVN